MPTKKAKPVTNLEIIPRYLALYSSLPWKNEEGKYNFWEGRYDPRLEGVDRARIADRVMVIWQILIENASDQVLRGRADLWVEGIIRVAWRELKVMDYPSIFCYRSNEIASKARRVKDVLELVQRAQAVLLSHDNNYTL
jgi:hypothetical protein